jgi:hypothetical protein
MERILFGIVCTVRAAVLAGTKRRRGGGWWCRGRLCGPCAWLAAVFPRISPTPVHSAGDTPSCPSCAEPLHCQAITCRFCQHDLTLAPGALPEDGLCHPLAALTPQAAADADRYLRSLYAAGYAHRKHSAAWDILTPSRQVCGTVTTLEELRDLAYTFAGVRRCATTYPSASGMAPTR